LLTEIKEILNSYVDLKSNPFRPSTYDEAKLVTNKLPESILEKLNFDIGDYKVEGSVGRGVWTDTPWVSIFKKSITESAQKGFYIVYLFRGDMSGVYLSLSQGTTYIEKRYKGQKPREKMLEVASKIRESLNYDNSLFPADDIELVANTSNAKNYMAAHICGKYYPLNNLPEDEELVRDLEVMVGLYVQLEKLIFGKSIEEALDYYLNLDEIEDTQFLSDVLITNPAKTVTKPHKIPDKVFKNGREVSKRDPSIAKEALQNKSFLCEVDVNHLTFKSNLTNENFVEAHHLIPMNSQKNFSWSLDVPGNIVSLCPNCHREIHHANIKERKKLIKLLYKKRYSELENYGISINLDDLYDSYSC
jgi:5-methylcytosine-specific restriction enzyme A